MKRDIYNEILDWKNNNISKPLMVIGARQVGKTYIIKKFCESEFQKYVYINLFDNSELIDIFARNISIDDKVNYLKIIIKDKYNVDFDAKDTVLFIDEIQESEDLISSLKFFNESEEEYKIICAGSLLGVKLNRMKKSFPVGKVKILYMKPMNFKEFLNEVWGKEIIDILKQSYENNEPLIDSIHDKLLSLYRLYLCVGGMPEAISDIVKKNKDILKFDKSIIDDIITGYISDMKKHVHDSTETVRIENIYRSIPSQIGNKSGKFQFAKINKDARSKNYIDALKWLLSSKMAIRVCNLKKVDIPPKVYEDEDDFKLYLSDCGLLSSLLEINYSDIMLDHDFIYKGEIAENYVLNQLVSNDLQIYFWKSNNSAEIDFIIYNESGLIPIEVKSGNKVQSKSLQVYMKRFKPKYGIRISVKNFGYENGIKSVPLYAAFLIK